MRSARGNGLLVKPLYGSAVLGGAVEDLDAESVADLARGREEDAEGPRGAGVGESESGG